MLKIADLAGRADFDAGPLHISPARRSIEGPDGRTTVEPIVMKVFLLLLDARGTVVTRDELFGNAWGGVFVGDDSLNRAIARVRKIAAETAPGLFEIETIPRTGYRLTGDVLSSFESTQIEAGAGRNAGISRRTIFGAAAGVGLAGAAGLGLWSNRAQDDRRFDALVRRGAAELEYGDDSPEAAKYFRQAVAIRPDDAGAQGMLAFALMTNAELVSGAASEQAVDDAEQAAQRSLQLDPTDANARLALTQLQLSTLDLAGTEDRLRGVLATAPNNIFAMGLLWSLLQCAGRSSEALAFVQRAIAIRPLAASNNYPWAQLLWIVGRTAEADRIIDRAIQYWPMHPYVRFARFTISAFTGRPRAALAMLDDERLRPQIFPPASVALWRISLAALDQPTPANVARAREANLDEAKKDPKRTSQAVLALSALGEVDAAFEVANELLVFRPPAVSSKEHKSPQRAGSTAWRFTPWLFTPPAAALRADGRFGTLCDGTGLTDYWTKRGIKPDYQRV